MSSSVIDLRDKSGYLHLILGPMFCGKTNELLNELLRFDMVGASVLYLNSDLDDRADTPFSTHHPLMVKSLGTIHGEKVKSLVDHTSVCLSYDVIGIDEAQFFPDLLTFVKNMVDCGKRVVVAGLNGNFRREPIGEILDLIPWADRVDHLTAICLACAHDRREMKAAPFSHRTVKDESEQLVGAADKYMAVCRTCFARLNG